ncbi:DUF4349 domain-containing protein [Luteimonas sp. BDR2-5]|uniref:DUF4349 domain-containing protein n=1 Tax=Proluteimonas luteida TaxID=2878685 RepID=UPI001E2EDDF1|nr:DUF4349 domain-containing protein [Luteimonas sp. BDR2-5]MCD9027997.1 DUF4349 domain-containing protein [Luteimonas sp. BDR2-5]
MPSFRFPSFQSLAVLPMATLLLVLGACAQQSLDQAADAAAGSFEAADAATAAAEMAAPAAAADVVGDGAPDVSQMTSATATQRDPARRFIRTAQLRFAVDDVYASALAIEDLAAKYGGFVVRSQVHAETRNTRRRPMGDGKLLELAEYVTRGNVTVRVPSDRLQAFLRELVGQMRFLDGRDFSAHDAQFDLLRQQLAFQRGQALQQSLGDAVQDDDRLDRKADAFTARAQALAARDEAQVAQREFEDRVAFATIDMSLYQPAQVRRTERVDTEAVFAQHGPGFFPRLGKALSVGWHGLLDVLVGLAALWPLWLLVAAAIAGWRALRRLRRRRAALAGGTA